MGRTTRLALLLAVCATVGLVARALPIAPPVRCRGVGAVQTSIGHLLVPVTLNGHSGLVFMVDTGSQRSYVDRERAETLDLDVEFEGGATGVGGPKVSIDYARVKRMMIGDVFTPLVHIGILDLEHVQAAFADSGAPRIDGIIGVDVLKGQGAIVDFVARDVKFCR